MSEVTDGNFKIQVFAAGEIVPACRRRMPSRQEPSRPGHTVCYYFWGKDPTWALASAVPFGLNARGMNAWHIHGGGIDLCNEFFATQGLFGLPCGNTGVQMGGWYRKEINTVADLQGLKYGSAALPARSWSGLGLFRSSSAPVTSIRRSRRAPSTPPNSLAPTTTRNWDSYKVAPYYYYPGFWEGGPTVHAIFNKAKYDELPPAYKAVLKTATQAADANMLQAYDWLNPMALKRLVADGAKLRPFSQEILSAAFDAANQVYGEIEATNAPFKKIWDSIKAFRKDHFLYAQVAEYNYDTFMMIQQRNGKL